jgi:NAD-dependent SIR2 family protein deacetylase
LNLYRTTVPHEGFEILRRLGAALPGGVSVFTSNVDGQFQRAGYPAEQVFEIHGSIHFVQCLGGCGLALLTADSFRVHIDPQSLRASDPLPRCPRCSSLLRPNILMFNDYSWDSRRSDEQEARQSAWVTDILSRGLRLGVVECGAGLAIPSVRHFCARLARQAGVPLIRINPREHEADFGDAAHIGIAMGAQAALKAIQARLAPLG